MKKLSISILAVFIAVISFNTSQAQFIKAGAGLMYGSEIEKIGLRVDGVYQINEEFRAVADLGIFMPDNTDFGGGDEITVTWWELNANGNYIFYADDEQGLNAYALAGLNLTTVRVKYKGDSFGNDSNSESELGLNIGAGAEYNLDFAELFGELKFVIGNADQLNIGIGLRFPLGSN